MPRLEIGSHLDGRLRAAHRGQRREQAAAAHARVRGARLPAPSSSGRTGTTIQSRTAIARLGAKQDGVLRNHRRLPDGSLRDTVVFSILDSEWPAVRTGLRHRLARTIMKLGSDTPPTSGVSPPNFMIAPVGPPRTLPDVSDAADLPLIGAAALRARAAARVLRTLPTDAKDAALAAMADALVERTDEVLAANAADVEAAAADGHAGVGARPAAARRRPASPAWPAALRELVALPDPVGDVVRGSRLPNGLQLRQVRVPLGVVGIVYEARPERDRRRRRAVPEERQRGAAARLGVGVPHQHRAGRRPHRGGAEGRAARGLRRAAAGRPGVGRGAAERPRHGRRRHPARGRGADPAGGRASRRCR